MMHRMFLTTRATFCNEIRLLLRDRFCIVLLACFSIGLAWASWTSHGSWREFANQQVELQSESREAWLSQTTANAHMATHVGQTVYKPVSPLASFDPGAISEFGSSIFVQSHTQSVAKNPPTWDDVDLIQNEAYSPAVLLELFGPLLVIVLGIASIAREKEGGTLSVLLTTGSRWSAIASGKGLAVMLTLFVVAAPGLVLVFLPWFGSGRLFLPLDLFIRESALLVMLAVYFAGWFGLTIFVASRSNSISGSFSVLIALWSILALVMPRIAGDVANFASPLPTNAEVRLEKEHAVHDSNQASTERAKATKALEEKLLAEFKVEKIEDLPIDMAGARMIQQEETTNQLYDEIERRVTDAKNRQNEIIGGFQFASPYMAIRAVSTSFAATDRKHHFDFLKNAENYRRQYVKELNTSEMKRNKPGSTPEARREFWAQVSEFQPRFVASAADLRRCMAAMCCVMIWGIVAIVAALNACPKVGGYGKD